MSKKTIYQVFPSKLALFDALLGDRVFSVPVAPDLPGGCQEQSLINLVTSIAGVLLRPDRMGLIRLVIVDGQASPELTTAFDRLKMAKDLNAMEVWLGQEQAQGRLRRGDVTEDARLLFGMTIAEPLLQALVRAPRPPGEPPFDLRIREAVRIFLRGLGAPVPAEPVGVPA